MTSNLTATTAIPPAEDLAVAVRRTQLVEGLRALADRLASSDDLPTDAVARVTLQYGPDTDAEAIAIAERLGADAEVTDEYVHARLPIGPADRYVGPAVEYVIYRSRETAPEPVTEVTP